LRNPEESLNSSKKVTAQDKLAEESRTINEKSSTFQEEPFSDVRIAEFDSP